jgi:CelD/BcsL family acetyltransferase involved in cellulose biosynthesis
LNGTWSDYFQSRSTRFRKTLRNVENRIKRLGAIRVDCYKGERLSAGDLQKLFDLSASSWKSAQGIAITSNRLRMHFFEKIVRDREVRDSVQIWFLHANDAPIASEIQVVDGSTVYALRSDYDEQYAEYSPGVYLQSEILKSLFRDCYETYNFGIGLNEYKERWTDSQQAMMTFRLYNHSLYSRLLRYVQGRDLSAFRQLNRIGSLHKYFASDRRESA